MAEYEVPSLQMILIKTLRTPPEKAAPLLTKTKRPPSVVYCQRVQREDSVLL